MKGLIINHDTQYIGNIINLFKNCDVIHYTNFNENRVEEYDYIILSGGPIKITGDNIKDEKEWLLKTNKPVLGICLGFQIICLTYDDKIKYNKFENNYNRKINEKFYFDDLEYDMFYNHSYYFNEIPNGFYGILENGILKYIKHDIKPIMAFQGHPEMTNYGWEIKDYFIKNLVKI